MTGFEILAMVLAATFLFAGLIALPVFIYHYQYKKVPQRTQWKISDKDIIKLIAEQADGYMSVKKLQELTSLSKSEANSRLLSLHMHRVLNVSHATFKRYYSLKEKPDKRLPPKLSDKAFLTKDDLILLFKHHNYKLSLQQICLDTGLPVSVIETELRRFIKEKIIVLIRDRFFNNTYLLEEPYRSQPDLPINEEDSFNLDLGKIYKKEIIKK